MTRMTFRLPRPLQGALVATALAAAPAPIVAQQSAASLEPVTSVEGITEYRLDNGLRVLLFPDPSKPQVTVNVTYFVGSRHEGYGETGMAHLLEHLLFKGTPNHPDIPQEFNERGAQPNGTTIFDRTNYYEIFPASDDNLEWAIDLESERMVSSRVEREDLDSEMTVVRNEMESGENNPLGILVERTLSTAYLWHNYGKSTIGARSDIEGVPIERLQAFYRRFYQPDNAMLVVAGNFDAELALNLVVEKFGAIPTPDRTGSNTLYPTYTAEPVQDGERRVTLRRSGEIQFATSSYHVPPGSHPDYAAVEVLSFILGDTPSGRLYKAMVETQIATASGASAFQLREAGPLLTFAVVPTENDLGDALGTMNATVEGVLQSPVTGEEVDRAKTALMNGMRQAFNSSAGIALQLSEWSSMGDWRLFFLHRDRVEQITADDVNRVAQAYIKPDNRTVGLFYPTENPDRADIPGMPDIAAMLDGYTGGEAVAQGEEFDPSPDNIEARTTRFELSNGMEVALLPKETRGDVAHVRIRLHFGDEESLMGRGTAGGFAGSMLMRGTVNRTRQQIQDDLDRLQTSGSVGGGPTQAVGQFQTVRDNVSEVIAMMGELVREPVFPQSEFDIMKDQQLSGLDQQRTEPQPLASIELTRHMEQWPVGHPNYTETIDEAIAAVAATTLDDAKAFYKDFWGPQSGNVVVVGDFDEAEVRAALEEAFGDWKSPRPYQRIASPFYDAPADNITIETPDKANAFFIAQQNFELRDTDPDYPALIMAGYMIGGGILNSRLATRVRVEDGLSYGVGGGISGHPIDPVGQFSAVAIYAPENAAALEIAFVEELEKVLSDGFTAEELATAQQGWLEGAQLSRAQDSALSAALSSGLYFDRTTLFDAELEERVRSVTLEEVNQAIRDRLDMEKITIVKAGDFAKTRTPVG
jgi:zinc protease